MDPRKLFADERLTVFCVYCGREPLTRDHVPSRVLLDEPYPSQLPVVPACQECNSSFSKNELYLACLVECVLTGVVDPSKFGREKVRQALADNPAICARMEGCRRVSDSGEIIWDVELDRVRNVVLKLARGHAAYELSNPQLDDPEEVSFVPLITLTPAQRQEFESAPNGTLVPWPEIESRAFLRAAGSWPSSSSGPWLVVQPNRYRYLVSEAGGVLVRFVISEYLACKVRWD